MINRTAHEIENTLKLEFSTEIIHGPCSVEQHFHKNIEIIVIIEGECTACIGDETFNVKQGQAIVILPFFIHSLKISDGGEIRRMNIGENLGLAFLQTVWEHSPSSCIFTPTKEILRYYLDMTKREFGTSQAKYIRVVPESKRIMAKSIIYSLLSEYVSSANYIPATSGIKPTELIERMIKYISDNYKDNISLVSMAAEFGYNPKYLSRKLNNTFGINFKGMLNQHRAVCSMRLVQDAPQKTFTEIAYESGFQSIRTFNQVFFDVFGKTPKQLRAIYIGKNRVIK